MFNNPLAITTSSLGLHPLHSLPEKIEAAASNGFSYIEVVYQEIEDYGKSLVPPLSSLDAARCIAILCSSANLDVLALNPLKNFEGHHSPLSTRLDLARHWLEIAATLRAQYTQVPSQFDAAHSSTGFSQMVEDLRELSDLAASYGVGIAYEAVAWGSYVDTWEASLRMVESLPYIPTDFKWSTRLWVFAR